MVVKGIFSDNAPKAIGPYSHAVQVGDFVYMSGQLPVDPVTEQIVSNDIKEQTQQVINNMMSVLAEMNLDLGDVVKTTVFMSDLSLFSQMNEVYGMFFAEPYPARSCVEVAALPKGALVEIEALALDARKYENMTPKDCGSCCAKNNEE